MDLRYSKEKTSVLLGAVKRVLESGVLLRGKETETFEAKFADFTSQRYCVGVGNGLDALTLVLMAWKGLYGWDDGDEVIVSGHTFVASWLSIKRAGLKPVGCDVRKEDFLMDCRALETVISPRTRAIMPVHLYGMMCDMPAIMEVTRRHGLKVLVDSAQCHRRPKGAYSWGNAAAFSFYPTKNLGAAGDAGCVTTNDKDVADRVRRLANYGGVNGKFELKGVNSRMDEIQAAILTQKLDWLEQETERRREIARAYLNRIRNDKIELPYKGRNAQESTFHIFPIMNKQRAKLQEFLREKGIDTLVHYPTPPHKQPAFLDDADSLLPTTEEIADEELSLPMYSHLSDEEVNYVIDRLNDYNL